jgi:hypothetical protein
MNSSQVLLEVILPSEPSPSSVTVCDLADVRFDSRVCLQVPLQLVNSCVGTRATCNITGEVWGSAWKIRP